MILEQEKFFEGLDFEEYEFEYPFGSKKCYKGKDGGFYRVDHFGNTYVIEFAENEDEAKLNRFEDSELFDDSLSEDELIQNIRDTLKGYNQY